MRSWPLLAFVACQAAPATTVPTDPALHARTHAQLQVFYETYGGRAAFPAHAVAMVEGLLFAQDEIDGGDLASARARIDALLAAYPLDHPRWTDTSGLEGINIGWPIAYYGVRMLDLVASEPAATESGTLTMTVVVAPCATVRRPTLGGGSETVELDVHPDILADDAQILHDATALIRRWLTTITRGLQVELVVHALPSCTTTVDYTDDGNLVVSYPDAADMIRRVPDDVAAGTDLWWVVAPSGVPGDGSGFDRHFITGGMGVYGAGLPLFLSDDAWFVRKPEHLGEGAYTDVERRVYQPQWFQHELMHHLFGAWPDLALEPTPHSWFDRQTWPDDFEGQYEPDYYTEAITKRLLAATPSLAEGLTAPEPVRISDPAILAGRYQRRPVENGWHDVTVSFDKDALLWTNAAEVSWSMSVVDGRLFTGPDCPYGETEVLVRLDGDEQPEALVFNGESYIRQ